MRDSSIPKLTWKEYQTFLKEVIESGKSANILLIGETGVGKSAITRSFSKKIPIAVLKLQEYTEVQDLMGLPQIKNNKTKLTDSPFITVSKNKRCILFLDDLNRQFRDELRNAVMGILDKERVCSAFQIHPDSIVIGAINPADENYQVSDLCPAMEDRFIIVEIVPTQKEVLAFGKKRNWEEGLLRFYEKESVKLSPRGLEKASAILEGGITLFRCRLALGTDLGKSFFAFYNEVKDTLFGKEKIVHNDEVARVWFEKAIRKIGNNDDTSLFLELGRIIDPSSDERKLELNKIFCEVMDKLIKEQMEKGAGNGKANTKSTK